MQQIYQISPKYWFLGYHFLVNIDLHRISSLLVYNILRFENTDIWLIWDDGSWKSEFCPITQKYYFLGYGFLVNIDLVNFCSVSI